MHTRLISYQKITWTFSLIKLINFLDLNGIGIHMIRLRLI